MKKIFVGLALLAIGAVSFGMDWSEYESLCWLNGKEPTYEEWEWLSTEGATDYGYEAEELERLFAEAEARENEN